MVVLVDREQLPGRGNHWDSGNQLDIPAGALLNGLLLLHQTERHPSGRRSGHSSAMLGLYFQHHVALGLSHHVL